MRARTFIYCISAIAATVSLTAQATTNPATASTAASNQAVLQQLPFADQQAFTDAQRGFVAQLPDGKVTNDDGSVAWDMSVYSFLDQEAAPDTVNPSLWRQAQLNNIHGLFKVTDGLYQIRGMDLANMTIIEGDTGLIIIDPLLSPSTTRTAQRNRLSLCSIPIITLTTGAALKACWTRLTSRLARRTCTPPQASWSTLYRKMSSPARR